MNKRIFAILICSLMCVGLVGCAEMHAEDPQKQQESIDLHSSIQREVDSPDWVKKLPAAEDATQLLVVAGMGIQYVMIAAICVMIIDLILISIRIYKYPSEA